MALYGISSLHPIFMLFVMTAVVLMQPPSAATQDQPDCTCNRFYCSGISRQDYSEYFNTYDSRVNQENKVLDSIEAQTSYINLADKTANSDDNQLKDLFHPGNYKQNATEVIKSLVELNLMREKVQEMGDLGQHTDVIATLLSHAADDACEYLKDNFPIANCTDNEQLEQLKNRLEFIEALNTAKELVRKSIECNNNKKSQRADYCAWMNDRALDKCRDSPTRSSQVFISLNDVCTKDRAIVNYPLCPQ